VHISRQKQEKQVLCKPCTYMNGNNLFQFTCQLTLIDFYVADGSEQELDARKLSIIIGFGLHKDLVQ